MKDFFKELSTMMANNYVKDLKKKDPEKLDQMIELFNNLWDIIIEIIKINPEFRQKFAIIHGEFLKHPESRQVIEGSIKAYVKYKELE